MTFTDPAPKLQGGATVLDGTDSYPARVHYINPSKKSCLIELDSYPNTLFQVRHRKTGKWRITKVQGDSASPLSYQFEHMRVIFGRRGKELDVEEGSN